MESSSLVVIAGIFLAYAALSRRLAGTPLTAAMVFVGAGLVFGADGLVWGGQNGSTLFNVVVASIVFAMALSLLGVWEVPIPGFFGSRSVMRPLRTR